MEAYLAEKNGIKLAFNGDLTAGGESARIDMGKGDRVSMVLYVPSHASDLDLTFRQHDAAAAGTSKDLLVKRSYFVKIDGNTKFTRKEQSVLAANIVDADFNGAAGLMVVEVLGEDMDRDLDFTHISVVIAARAVTGSAIYEVCEMRQKPAYSVSL